MLDKYEMIWKAFVHVHAGAFVVLWDLIVPS